jgi:hypothetical protein
MFIEVEIHEYKDRSFGTVKGLVESQATKSFIEAVYTYRL